MRPRDVPKLLRDAQIDPAICSDPRARISLERLRDFWTRAPAAAGDEALGLRAAECIAASSFDIYGYIAKSSATGRDAFRRSQRYGVMLGDHYSSDILLEGDRAVVRQLHAQPVPRVFSDFGVAAVVRLGREFYAPTFPLLEVRFGYPEPADTGTYAAYFKVPVRFGCRYDAIVLPATLLDTHHKDADEQLCRILQRQADASLERWWSAQGFATRARQLILEQLQNGDVTVAAVAKRLAVSPRTLRRRLHEEGTSHAQLVEEVRHRLAQQYLGQGRTVDDVATSLGFVHVRAFRAAMRRWTGETFDPKGTDTFAR